MRALVFIVLAAATVLACGPRRSEAAYNAPWCAQYFDQGRIFSCAFYSFEQCQASISGIGGVCMQNPSAPPPPNYAARPPKRHPHVEQN
jgi:hypothetical protein